MAIVGGFDVHRSQITFDYVDDATGEVRSGRIQPADRLALREWLADFDGRCEVAFALEGGTGWRYIVEELHRAGCDAHVAEPADTAALRGRKKRAKTDRADARQLRDLLLQHRVPESWVPPPQVLEVRTTGRLYAALASERHKWQQRVRAQLFHQGVPRIASLGTAEGRAALAAAELSPAGRQLVDVALIQIDRLGGELLPLRRQLAEVARTYPGPRSLLKLWGIGALTAPIIWSEMGDTRRFSNSAKAVRHTGLDVTVHASDTKRAAGHLARQGPSALRWALVEAAHAAARSGSPDHRYYRHLAERVGSGRAVLSVARKLARRVHHTLRALGDTAWAPLT
jgi:transposase